MSQMNIWAKTWNFTFYIITKVDNFVNLKIWFIARECGKGLKNCLQFDILNTYISKIILVINQPRC